MAKDYDAWESMFAEPSNYDWKTDSIGGFVTGGALMLITLGVGGWVIRDLLKQLPDNKHTTTETHQANNIIIGVPALTPLFRTSRAGVPNPQFSNATDLQDYVENSVRALKAIHMDIDTLMQYRQKHRESHDTGYEAAKHDRIDERLAELEEQSKLINMDLEAIFAHIGDWFTPPLVRETDPESTRRYL